MQKYAFVENIPDLSVEPYMTVFDDGEWHNVIAGKNGIAACMAYLERLLAEGYSLINLCGDFGPDHVAELMHDAPEGTEIHFAAYLPEELAKLEALEQYVEYGQIIFGGVEEPMRLELKAPQMNTHTVFIKDLDQAIAVAEDFARAGVDGIELCSSFDLDMTKAVIEAVEAIDPKIPIGSNGITI